MGKLTLFLAAFSGALAVGFGAFGSHALRERLDEYALRVYDTAVNYHFIHSLALLAVGVLLLRTPQLPLLTTSAWLFLMGILIFSGSLYMLALTGTRWLGALTPIGGLAFVGGWLCLAVAAWRLT